LKLLSVFETIGVHVLCGMAFIEGSGYRAAHGSLNLKPYSTTSCNMTVTHEKNAVGLLETQ